MMQSLIEGLQIIEDHLRNPDGATILGAAVVVFVLWFLFIRRR
jgi:uncharacterized protein (TIGR03382 family)